MKSMKNVLKPIFSLSSAAVLFAAMGIVFSSAAVAAGDRLGEILQRGTVRIGVQGAFKPWSFPSESGAMQGIEVDLGKQVAQTLGVKFEPVIITSANRIQFLQQNRIDLIIGGMYDTAERRKIIGIVEPSYWSSGPTLMARKGQITKWDDITGKPVCAKQGVYYNKQVETRYKAKLIAFNGNTEAKEALRAGRCVAWVYDDVSIIADLEMQEWQDYEMAVPVLYSIPWAAAVPLDQLDKGWGAFMAGMAYRWHAEGALLKLADKWGVAPSIWFSETRDRLHWDTAYLNPN